MQNPRSPSERQSGSGARHWTSDYFRAILHSDQAGGGCSGGGKALLPLEQRSVLKRPPVVGERLWLVTDWRRYNQPAFSWQQLRLPTTLHELTRCVFLLSALIYFIQKSLFSSSLSCASHLSLPFSLCCFKFKRIYRLQRDGTDGTKNIVFQFRLFYCLQLH